MKLKVAIVQYDANEPDIAFNTDVAVGYIKEAKSNGADIVLFPECFCRHIAYRISVKNYIR